MTIMNSIDDLLYDTIKKCTKCNIYKEYTEYYTKSNYCKECKKLQRKGYNQKKKKIDFDSYKCKKIDSYKCEKLGDLLIRIYKDKDIKSIKFEPIDENDLNLVELNNIDFKY